MLVKRRLRSQLDRFLKCLGGVIISSRVFIGCLSGSNEKGAEGTGREDERGSPVGELMANFGYFFVYDSTEKLKKINKTLVDVTGIEPVTPCLQRRERKSI